MMVEMLEITLGGQVGTAEVVSGAGGWDEAAVDFGYAETSLAVNAEAELRAKGEQVEQLCEFLSKLAVRLGDAEREFYAEHKKSIVALAVGISERIVAKRIGEGDYDIEAVVTEAMSCAPAGEQVVVRLNCADLRQIETLEADGFERIKFVADGGIKKGDCAVDTSRGTIERYIEESLRRVGNALGKVC